MFANKYATVLVLVLVLLGGAINASSSSVNVKDFGAKGDGSTDDTEAIQKALDTAQPNGVANLPAGAYILSATLHVPNGTTLLGEGARWENSAVQLIIPQPGFVAVTLGNGSGVKGIAFVYPNNTDNANPTPYPPTIQLNGINPSVENIAFGNAWIGVSTPPGGGNAGQGMFSNLTGFVHYIGMHLSGCRDVCRIQDVHWFVGGKDTPGKRAFYRENRVGFEFGDVDGIIMERCFIIGAKTFLHQKATKDTRDGSVKGAHSLGFHIDQSWIEDVDYGFIFEGALGFVLSSANILVRENGVGVRALPGNLFYNGVINGVQVRSFGKPIVGFEYGCAVPHPRNRLSIADCQVVDGSPALHLTSNATRANVHDSHFQAVPGSPVIQIDKGADLFTITNNILSGGAGQKPITDNSGRKARKTISGNVIEKK